MPVRLGILLSGSGTTYENLATACADGMVPATIAVVVASRADCGGVARAQAWGHELVIASQPVAVSAALITAACDWVAMCGWLKYYDPPPELAGKVLNIHPSLLPAFGGIGMYGRRVHQAVIDHGCRVSGCTVHVVSGDYDSGRIIAQEPVRVHCDDNAEMLGQRVQEAERACYPRALAALMRGHVTAPTTR